MWPYFENAWIVSSVYGLNWKANSLHLLPADVIDRARAEINQEKRGNYFCNIRLRFSQSCLGFQPKGTIKYCINENNIMFHAINILQVLQAVIQVDTTRLGYRLPLWNLSGFNWCNVWKRQVLLFKPSLASVKTPDWTKKSYHELHGRKRKIK